MSDEEKLLVFLKFKKAGVTSKKIAKQIGISASLLSQFLNNNCEMSRSNIEKLKSAIAELESK